MKKPLSKMNVDCALSDKKQTFSCKPDSDTPWKDVLERYFEQFIQFFFPDIHPEINWNIPHEFLDKELQKVARDARIGRRIVDKLINVRLNDGSEKWVLIHVEIQGEDESEFARRMYVYNYRLFDRYDRQVASLAVLTDERESWRPDRFGYDLFGCTVGIRFPVVKLLDYRQKWDMLENSDNPFAIVVMAHLKHLETRYAIMDRLHWKISLVKRLYEHGYSRKEVITLFRYIDWMLTLPDELEERFSDTIYRYEEEKKMPYITSVEKIGIKKGLIQGIEIGEKKGRQAGWNQGRQEGWNQGRQEGLGAIQEAVIDVLESRFGVPTKTMINAINKIQDIATLKGLLKSATSVASLKDFKQEMTKFQ